MKVIVYQQWKKGKSIPYKGKYPKFEGDIDGDSACLYLFGKPHNILLVNPRLIGMSADGMRIEGKEEAECDSTGRRLYYHQEWWVVIDYREVPK